MTRPNRIRGRLVVVLGSLAGGLVLLIAGGGQWLRGAVAGAESTDVSLTGADLAPALTPLALAALAAAVGLLFAGRVLARILGAIEIALGAAAGWIAATAVLDPTDAVRAAIAKATGLDERAAGLVDASMTPGPAAAFGAAIVLTTAGVLALFADASWAKRDTSARYERSDSGLAWDALDDGDDPTKPR